MRVFVFLSCLFCLAGCTSPGNDSEDDSTFLRPETEAPLDEALLHYTYGAKFEPPEGRIIHGMGQYPKGNEAYLGMLGDESLYPLSRLLFIGLADQPRPWSYVRSMLEGHLDRAARYGSVPHISISFNARPEQDGDVVFADTDELDSRGRDIVNAIARFGRPVFVRIGGEFNGEWNGFNAYHFPRAFRKLVEMFREKGVDNAAFIWCYMPVAADDFDERNAEGEYKWFPGEDVIDWFGIDVFAVHQFTQGRSGRARHPSVYGKTVRFLRMAEQYRKPVIVAESSAARLDISPDSARGERYWKAYFEPFFEWIRSTPGIRAFHYINYDWSESAHYSSQGWTNARVDLNPTLRRRYRREMMRGCYLHLGQGSLLKDYDLYQ